jgi:hypothetical protein
MKHTLETLLARIRPDVTDALDTTTQLETLGYNRYRVKRDFNFKNTFELGKELFRLLPKRGFFPSLLATPIPLLRYLLIFLGVLLSLATSSPFLDVGLMALFTWSLIFSRLLGQATIESKKTYSRLFTLALLSGLLLIILSSLNKINLKDIALLLFWWNLNLSFWQQPKIYWRLFLLLALGAFIFISPIILLIALLAFSLFFLPQLDLPKPSTWQYLKDNLWGLLLTALYALGQAYILWYLVKSSAHPWNNLLLLTGIVLASEWLETSLIDTLRNLLWNSKNREDYHERLLSSIRFWGQMTLILISVGILLALKVFATLPLLSLGFALLGLSIGLSFILLRLEQLFLVAIGFMIAAFLVFLGFPLWIVMLGLILIFSTGMMLLIMRVESSSISIL